MKEAMMVCPKCEKPLRKIVWVVIDLPDEAEVTLIELNKSNVRVGKSHKDRVYCPFCHWEQELWPLLDNKGVTTIEFPRGDTTILIAEGENNVLDAN